METLIFLRTQLIMAPSLTGSAFKIKMAHDKAIANNKSPRNTATFLLICMKQISTVCLCMRRQMNTTNHFTPCASFIPRLPPPPPSTHTHTHTHTLWACLPTTPRYLAMCSVWDDGFSVPRVYYTACTCETMIYWGERKWVELRFYIYIYYLAYIIPYISDALIAASRMRNISKIFVRTTWFLWKPAWMMTIMKDSQEGQLECVHLCMKKVIVVFQWWHSG